LYFKNLPSKSYIRKEEGVTIIDLADPRDASDFIYHLRKARALHDLKLIGQGIVVIALVSVWGLGLLLMGLVLL